MATIDNLESAHPELIAASRVKSTNVYDAAGTKVGSIYDVMIEKVSGKVNYAIMSFGGFLGMGERYHPFPWNQLKYDTRLEGYVVNVDRSRLEGAPNYSESELPAWNDLRSSDIDTYYGSPSHPEIGGVAGSGLGVPRDPLDPTI